MEHPGAHGSINDLLWPVFNFAAFAGLLAYVLRGPIREYFRDRTERLREGLEAGARARREAEALRAEFERDLADLPALRERLKADLRAMAEQECAQLLAAARAAADRIRADARLVAEQEGVAARAALRAEVIDEAVREGAALVQGALGPADHQRFLRDFIRSAGAPS